MSTTLTRTLGLLSTLIALMLAGCGDDGAKQDVRNAFDSYITARLNKNSDAMLALIDPENIKHDDYIVEMARSGTKVQLMKLTAYDRLQVTLLRGTLKAAQLKELDGRKLFKMSTEQQWETVGDPDGELTLGEIKLNKPRASAELVYDGEPTGIRLELVEVEHKWLINKDSFDRVANRVIENLATIGYTTDDDIIIRIASRSIGKEQHKAIWDEPPK